MTSEVRRASDQTLPGVRLDVWLDVSCLFKTRSEAQRACRGGKVDVNGQAGKPNRLLREGDELSISRGHGQKQRVVVRGLAEQHLPKADARLLYEDRTPPPTPEQIAMRQMERVYRAMTALPRSPDTRTRRALRKMKEGGGPD